MYLWKKVNEIAMVAAIVFVYANAFQMLWNKFVVSVDTRAISSNEAIGIYLAGFLFLLPFLGGSTSKDKEKKRSIVDKWINCIDNLVIPTIVIVAFKIANFF